jgi:hypothetical protein
LFTSYGISGPTILDLSRLANTAIDHGEEVKVRVILVPKDKEIKIDNRFFDNPMKPIDLCLVGLIHKRLISPLLKEAKIVKQNAPASTLSRADIERITALLYGWEFVVTGTKSFEDAQVTAGGIATKQVDARTLESRLVKGLFFAGEILDIDGPCGGYNLQWAWSSGYVAALSASVAE